MTRTLFPLERFDDAPSADIADYPAMRTLAPLAANEGQSGHAAAAADASRSASETPWPMGAQLAWNAAQNVSANIPPFGVRQPARLASRAFGLVALVTIAGGVSWWLLHATNDERSDEPVTIAKAAKSAVDDLHASSQPEVATKPSATDLSGPALPPASIQTPVTPPDIAQAPDPAAAVSPPPAEIAVVAQPPTPPPAEIVAIPESSSAPPAEVPVIPEPPPSAPPVKPVPRDTAAALPSSATKRPAPKGAALVAEGYRLFTAGDVDAARAVFEQAAVKGDMDAAFALGVTYDPKALAHAGLTSAKPDAEKAVYWYRRSHLIWRERRTVRRKP